MVKTFQQRLKAPRPQTAFQMQKAKDICQQLSSIDRLCFLFAANARWTTAYLNQNKILGAYTHLVNKV